MEIVGTWTTVYNTAYKMLCNVNSFSLRNMFSFQRQGRNVSLNTKGAKSKGHACIKNSYSFNNIEFSKGS